MNSISRSTKVKYNSVYIKAETTAPPYPMTCRRTATWRSLSTIPRQPKACTGLGRTIGCSRTTAITTLLKVVATPQTAWVKREPEKLKEAIVKEGTIKDEGIEEAMAMYTSLMDPTKPALACASCGVMDVPVTGETAATGGGESQQQFTRGIRRAAESGTAYKIVEFHQFGVSTDGQWPEWMQLLAYTDDESAITSQ